MSRVTRTSGCVVYSIKVENDFGSEIPEIDVYPSILQRLKCQLYAGECSLSEILDIINPQYDSYSDEPCDQCGDTITTEIWELVDVQE